MFRRRLSHSFYCTHRFFSNSSFSITQTTADGAAGGRPITFSSGKYARLADGATIVECGSTCMMVTAVSRPSSSVSHGLPLTVDYRERGSAVGRIPHNFLRRELRPSDREILTSRAIDRSIRPLFPKGYYHQTQVICEMFAADAVSDPYVLGINGASAALAISDIPWSGPIAAVCIGCIEGNFVVNPTTKQLNQSAFNLLIACTRDKIVMLEGFGKEITEKAYCEAVELGLSEAQPIIQTITKLQEDRNKAKRTVDLLNPSSKLQETVHSFCYEKILKILSDASYTKMSRDKQLFRLRDEVKVHVSEVAKSKPALFKQLLGMDSIDSWGDPSLAEQAFWNVAKKAMNHLVLYKQIRCDGRDQTGLRPIECEVDVFPAIHGSSLFRRGETQVVSSVTFDSPEIAAKADALSSIIGTQKSRNFMIHYEFPPFAINETGPFLVTGRREIGHAALAERAIKPLIPNDFPFTVRVTSQVTDSNGSSSMATVCGSSLALYDAGVMLAKPAAGVALGLMMEKEPESETIKRHLILSDLSGIEDALGYMDFKIAGTRDGITSCQLDIKDCHGLTYDMVKEAIERSRDSRHEVLDIMDFCQADPRYNLKDNTPVYETIEIPLAKRYKLIGTGGYKIRALVEETGAEMTTISDETMSIFAPSQTVMNEVQEKIDALINAPDIEEHPLEVGAIYTARVIDIKPFGLTVELSPSKQTTLLHISQLDHKKISHPDELGFQLGQEFSVKYFGRNHAGRIQVSRKALLKNPYKRQGSAGLNPETIMSTLEEVILESGKKAKKPKSK